ncbi:MAG: hypothetical protein ACTII7_13585 [Galactobacter sp.]
MTSTTPASGRCTGQDHAPSHGHDLRHSSGTFRPWPDFPYGGEDPDFHIPTPTPTQGTVDPASDGNPAAVFSDPTPTDRLRILGAGLLRSVREATARTPKH